MKLATKGMGRCFTTIRIVMICLSLSGCNQEPFKTSPYATAVDVNPELRASDVQKSYNQGLKNDYIAISGTELLKSMILNSLERFVMALRARTSEDDLRQNLSSFGYFAQSTSLGIKEVCDPSRGFMALAALRAWTSPFHLPCSGRRGILPVQLAYDGRSFVVPGTSGVLTAVSLFFASSVFRPAVDYQVFSDLWFIALFINVTFNNALTLWLFRFYKHRLRLEADGHTSLPPAFRTENRITLISLAVSLLLLALFMAAGWWFRQPPQLAIPFLAGNKGFEEVGVHILKVENHSELHPRAGLIPYPPL